MRDMNFMHIPRTGGSSIEATIKSHRTMRWRVRDCCRWSRNLVTCCKQGSPWHLPLDVLALRDATLVKEFKTRPIWCIVRSPVERWASSISFIANTRARWSGSLAFPRPQRSAQQLKAAFSCGRFRTEWDEELAHMQPQSWMVWDALGSPQCSCAVPFEQLSAFTSLRLNSRKLPHGELREVGVSFSMPQNMSDLYAEDMELWQNALRHPGPCYPLSSRGRPAFRRAATWG